MPVNNPNPDQRGLKRFQKGQSGNPAGRPPILADIREKARAHAAEAFQALLDVAMDTKAPPSARVSAASEILSRGYGKPTASVDVAITATANLHLQALRSLADMGRQSQTIDAISQEKRALQVAEVALCDAIPDGRIPKWDG